MIMILKRESGFTLLEVVFASAILAFGILGYTQVKTASRYSRVYAKQLSQSVQLTTGQMEDFILRGYNSPLLSAAGGALADLPGGALTAGAAGDFSFTGANWTVREKCPSDLAKLIQFTGQWGSGKQLQLTQVQVRP